MLITLIYIIINSNLNKTIIYIVLNIIIISMPHYPEEIEYSEKYNDSLYEYRHVILPKELYKKLPKLKLLSENEWRSLGVQQSRGWVHYDIHKPEPHILLFRRPIGTDAQTGIAPNEILQKIKQFEESMYEAMKNN